MAKALINTTRRRWFALSLRSLLALFAIPTTIAYFVQRRVAIGYEQQAVVDELESLGASIGYAHEWDDQNDRRSTRGKPGTAYLRSVLGEHFFLRPRCLVLSDFRGTSSDLEPIRYLTTLTDVGIVDSPNEVLSKVVFLKK